MRTGSPQLPLPYTPVTVPKNGTLNKVTVEDQSAHRWYRFVLSFPPHLVRDYLTKFAASPQSRVLDPFCGTGTTLVECKKLGIPSVGIEAHPMSQFAAKVKLDWCVDPDGLQEHANNVAHGVRLALEEAGLDDSGPCGDLTKTQLKRLHALPREASELLLKNSISPLPLHKTLTLLRAIENLHDPRYCQHELLAVAKAAVFRISNLHFGPEVGVQKAKPDAAVVAAWLHEISSVVADVSTLRMKGGVPAFVHRADSRQAITKYLQPNSIDIVITSPPYPNEKDYTRTTRLESVLLGLDRRAHV